ncbi:MAG: MFS transporter [Actinobacteria bacterium]|nr:MFS transporter [Actinomycetota bacterium]
MDTTPDRGRWLGLVVLTMGVSMIIVDATVVNVAIPTIIRDLDMSAPDAEWMNTIYSLVFAALLVSVGRAGDLFGRRRLFLAGVGVFVAASLWAGRSGGPAELIAARFVQGVGGAMILPSTLSSVNAMFRGKERAIAFGVWGSVIGGMAALGPLVGGWLTTDHSWRWIFYINLPVGALAVAGALRLVPETRDRDAPRGTDLTGVLASALGLGALVFALIESQRHGWWEPTGAFSAFGVDWPFEAVSIVPVALAVAVGALAAFVIVERRRSRVGKPVVVDLSMFAISSFLNGNLAAMAVSLGELGLLFALPLFVQSVLGYSALQTGWVFVALASGAFVAGGLAAHLAGRYGARRVVMLGFAVEVLSLLALVPLLSATTGGWALSAPLFFYGLGLGLATAQLTSAILIDIPPRQSGQASGLQSTFRQVGSALGIAILGTMLVVGLGTRTESNLARVDGLPPEAQTAIAGVVRQTAGAILPQIPEMTAQMPDGVDAAPIVAAVEDAFVASTRVVALAAAGFILIGLLAAARLPQRTITDDRHA